MRHELWRAVFFTAAAACLSVVSQCRAETSLIVHGVSKHSGATKYNENHAGLGVRHQASPNWGYQVGTYRNSYNKQTTYAAVNYTPLHYGSLSLGAFAGVGTGYKQPVMAGLLAVYDFGKVAASVRAVPGIAGLDSVVALEIGIKF